jgi:hypothetical protein
MGLFKAPDHSKTEARGMGYKSDGRKAREKIKRGNQRMLLDSTKLLLDDTSDEYVNPYDAIKRVDESVYAMFHQSSEDG